MPPSLLSPLTTLERRVTSHHPLPSQRHPLYLSPPSLPLYPSTSLPFLNWQLREETTDAASELDGTKEALRHAQQSLSVTLAEARELKRQSKVQVTKLQEMRREHELLAEALHCLRDTAAWAPIVA